MSARVLASAASLLLASCGLPSAPVSTAPTAATSGSAATATAASGSAPAAASASAAAAGSAWAEPAASDPVVMELRKAMPEKTLTLRASGRIERVITLPFADEERAPGRVAPASVEAFHAALRAARFCELAPKARESAPSYTIIEASFPDVACLIELPDTRWEKTPVAKKVIDAARRLEAEAFLKP